MGHVRWGRNERPEDPRSIRSQQSRRALKRTWKRPLEGAPRARSRPVRTGETRQDLLACYCCRSVVNETPTSPPGEAMVT